ncbi:hypothetical protein T10_1017 [Trichinella papuae]|uniref:Uncharacterized protein n=1 Tax=Trichinella papuae TaxID=268474 RepID=A0A0V1MFK3_9BILA|nr:hypothetical protein T10_1017 [Trichinella papuae]
MKKIKTLNCTERRRCEREVGLRQHRFRDSRRLAQTGQLVWTCPDFRFHASTIQNSDYKAPGAGDCMNRSGNGDSAGTHIPRMLRADCNFNQADSSLSTPA